MSSQLLKEIEDYQNIYYDNNSNMYVDGDDVMY